MNNRPIYEIAADIRANWPKINYAAKPYLDAMDTISDINEMYYADTARSCVLYFLANARAFRGEEAKRIKAELKAL
jgi:hypothetical protein